MASRPQPLEPRQQRSQATRRRLLDAAVDELVDGGYVRLTTSRVARRAGVTRGAQQHHFPHRATLVVEAVRHLSARQLGDLRAVIDRVPRGRARVERALDAIFAQFRGPLFKAIVELSLSTRDEPELRAVLDEQERETSHAMRELAGELFATAPTAADELEQRWSVALSAIRGLALLELIGHPPRSVERQWPYTRSRLLALLTQPTEAGAPPARRPARAPARAARRRSP